MYECKFVKIEFGFFGAQEDYHDIIEQYLQEGWRFVQIFAPTGGSGMAAFYEIIFEREIKEP